MTGINAPISTALPFSYVADPFVLLPIALKCLGLALHHDYLSNGNGHQHTRRVLRDRSSKAKAKAKATEAGDQDSKGKLKKRSRLSHDGCADTERRYLNEIAAIPRLTSSEEYSLASRMRARGSDWQQAHDQLISANLGLVVMFAYRYQRPGLPLLDLIAEGNMGLMKAAVRFDPELGYRFATYAKWWVRQTIQLALPKLIGVVRMPVSHSGKNVPRPIELACGAEDSSSFFAEETHADDGEILAQTGNPNVDQQQAQPQAYEHVSDAAFISEASDAETIASLAIAQDAEPPGAVMAAQRTKVLNDALAALGERDSMIIAGRFALSDDHVCTLQELAQRFDVSIERVRQIESSALKRLAKMFDKAGLTAEALL